MIYKIAEYYAEVTLLTKKERNNKKKVNFGNVL